MTHTPAPQTITDRITQHAQATAVAEQEAREIDNLMRTVPGLPAGFLDQRRRVGELRNPWAGAGNMTAQQALLAWPDPAIKNLCTYLADKAGKPLPAPDYERIAKEEQAREAEASMAAWVEEQRRLREQVPPPDYNVQLNLGYGPGAQADLLEGNQRRKSERAF
jgi:hypothetical protein